LNPRPIDYESTALTPELRARFELILHEGKKIKSTIEALSNTYDTIIFDLGGVVLNIDYERTLKAFRDLGFSNFDQLYTQFKQSDLFVKLEKGLITPFEFLNTLQAHSDRHVTHEELTDAWNAMLLDLPPENLEAIKKLQQRFHIYLLSNTNAIHYECFFDKVQELLNSRSLEPYFHASYYSHLVGERKPDQAVFQLLVDHHQLSPSRTLFIDDSPQHIEAAKGLGFHIYQKDQAEKLIATLQQLGLV
jgi:HAD superfamily hydrolase (TIGR01509 family)